MLPIAGAPGAPYCDAMNFWGADTEQLRELARRGERLCDSLEHQRTTVATTIRTVPWQGADRERFDETWRELDGRWQKAHASAQQMIARLVRQAADQDRTSAADEGTAGANPTSSPPLGPRVETDGPSTPPKYRGTYDNPEDEFSTTPGSGGTTRTLSLDGDGGSASVSRDHDGNLTTTMTSKTTLAKLGGELERGHRGAEVSAERTMSTSGAVKENQDGTITYTVESELSDSAKAELKAKYGASIEGSLNSKDTYEVTVPRGTSPERALAINPYNPASIPRGAGVTYSASQGAEGGGSATAYLMTMEGSHAHSEGSSTGIMRNADGSLSVTTGPTKEVTDRMGARLGTEELNAHLFSTDVSKDTTFQTASFDDSPAGHEAYLQALNNGMFPTQAGDGVKETYVEHQSARTVDASAGVTAGPVAYDESDNMFTRQSVDRDYPDGHKEHAEQWVPQGDANPTSMVMSSSSDRPESYVLTSPTGDADRAGDAYDAHAPHGSRTSIVLTQSEAEQTARGMHGWSQVPDDASTAESMSILLQSSRSSDDAINRLDTFHNAQIDEDGHASGFDSSAGPPGRLMDPDLEQVRDGKVQPIPEDKKGKAIASG